MKKFLKNFFGLGLMVLSVVTVASDKPPIRIGVSLGLTGEYESLGKVQQRAFQLWEKHVNKRGGILARPVQLIVRDDEGKTDIAKKIYQDFILNEKVDFVFCPATSVVASAIIPITEQYGYPLIASGASSDELWTRGYTHLFATIPSAGRRAI